MEGLIFAFAPLRVPQSRSQVISSQWMRSSCPNCGGFSTANGVAFAGAAAACGAIYRAVISSCSSRLRLAYVLFEMLEKLWRDTRVGPQDRTSRRRRSVTMPFLCRISSCSAGFNAPACEGNISPMFSYWTQRRKNIVGRVARAYQSRREIFCSRSVRGARRDRLATVRRAWAVAAGVDG